MFSKKHQCLTLSFVLVMTSCTPKVGEAPPEQKQQKLAATQCLSGLQPVIEAFVAGTATDAEVASGWDCAATAISKFKKYVYGRSADRFEATEVADFISDNFLDPSSSEITPGLRIEVMRIKQLFLGGSIDYLTRAELDKIITMLGDLKKISLQLNPYMKLVSQKWSIVNSTNIQDDVRYFEKASDEIQEAAHSLANMLVENNQSYELDHFVAFLREFSTFTGQEWPFLSQIEKGMPVIKKVKKAIAGGDQNSIDPKEWKSFVLLGARGYLQYLRYYYFIKSVSDTGSGIRLGYLARSVEDLLGAFQDLVQQKPVDPSCGGVNLSCISKHEISEILKAFSEVWREFHVSDVLIDEGMKIKKVYFGGSELNITSQDFERGKNKVGNLKLVVEKFLPYYPVYSFEWDMDSFDYQTGQEFFKEAQTALQTTAEDLGKLFEDSYNIENLNILLAEIDRLYPNSENPDEHLADSQKFIPLVKDIKNIIFSENDALIKKSQWSAFLKYTSGFYSAYLYQYYFLEKKKLGSPEFLESFKKLADQVLNLTKEITLLKKNSTITAAELNRVAGRFAELEIIPKGLTTESIDQLVKVILNRLLWPAELRLKGQEPNGITPVSVEYLRSEIQIWYETEKYLYSLAAAPMLPNDFQNVIAKKLKDSKISQPLKTGLTEISMMVAGPVAQTVDANGHLVITNLSKPRYDLDSVARLNLNRFIGRFLIRAGTTNKGRLERYEGVDLQESQTLFDQVRAVVVEMGLLDKKNTNFMESRFREANIFTAHSNGDKYVNFAEMTDSIGMIMSGMAVNSLFRKDIDVVCRDVVILFTDVFFAEKCLQKVYIEQTANYMKATPDYVKFFKKMDLDEAEFFLKNILKAAGHIPNNQSMVKAQDADLVPHVIQYIEMTMAKYDKDKNGVINLSEAKKAFPSFKGILQELTKDQSLIKEKDLLALFIYILHYGKPPGGIKDFLFKWLPWKSEPSKWTVSANREDLGSILGYIGDQVANLKAKPTKASFIPEDEAEAIRQNPYYRAYEQ